MKAITIQQPYAELIAGGAKRVENRTWPTHYRGPLAIHAGLSAARRTHGEQYGLDFSALPRGAIVAVADLVACLHMDELSQQPGTFFGEFAELHSFRWLLEHAHTEGPWCWVLANVRRLTKPLECPGKQSIWNIPPELEPKIKRRLPR